MKQKHILPDNEVPLNFVLITLDNHMSGAIDAARARLFRDMPGLRLTVHAATDWAGNPAALQRCLDDIANANIIVATMLFIEEHVKAVSEALAARQPDCDAMICCMSTGEIMKLTRMGRFKMDGSTRGPLALLKKLRGDGSKKKSSSGKTAGERQLAMLRRLPKLLRFIPGTAQDIRNYFLTLQYRIAGSEENIANMVRLLTSKYATGPRKDLGRHLKVDAPVDYPEVGAYHPDLPTRMTDSPTALPVNPAARGTIGLLMLRTYILAGDTGHYDAAIRAYEAAGYNVVPVFSSALDMRGAIEKFMIDRAKKVRIDALVSLTGFSLVGGPAFSDAAAAAAFLGDLDVPYICAHVSEFQTLEEWHQSAIGLTPLEATMMVAIPELDGAISPMIFGGRTTVHVSEGQAEKSRTIHAHDERLHMLVGRTGKLVDLRKKDRASRKLALTVFNFPPNAGKTGTAAFLSVWESVYEVMQRLRDEGYDIHVPTNVDALRDAVLVGNAQQFGTEANVHARVHVDDYVRSERRLAEIEAHWGPAPGRTLTNGRELFVLGRAFGNLLITVQPPFGYEGDPMRLLFDRGFTPTHAFCAHYDYLKNTYEADAIFHFGTHGALEFLPGKQVGLSGDCWPDYLIGDLPNFYLYAANNPSEGLLAKRRSAATLVSYLTPPVTHAGLYKGLIEIKSSLDSLARTAPQDHAAINDICEVLFSQADALDLACEEAFANDPEARLQAIRQQLHELEMAAIPDGLHVVGRSMDATARRDMLKLSAETEGLTSEQADELSALIVNHTSGKLKIPGDIQAQAPELATKLTELDRGLSTNAELNGVVHALDGRFVRPSSSGDVIRSPDVLPTGRNTHGFDPFGIPSQYAMKDGARQAALVLERHVQENGAVPETVAIVLWGTDNLKSAGCQLAQAMALIGARPRLDAYSRVCGAELLPLEDMDHPRIDVLITLSGIFRDLLPIQSKMLAEASYLAAMADEPSDRNFVRKHVLAYADTHDCSLEAAACRVFSNAEGAYGSNVNYLISSSAWEDEDEIADTFISRKCFAIDHEGKTRQHKELLSDLLSHVDLAYQNLESVELGVTTIDQYFDSLGSIAKSGKLRQDGKTVPVYISDQTMGHGKVRTLSEQITLETRTRSLNPKWYEGVLRHGYEGVSQIETQVNNTFGWSATTETVSPWVYQQISDTFILDPGMRSRLAELNPASSARMASKLIEAHERKFWEADEETLEALEQAGWEFEDRLEGIVAEAAE